MAAQGQHLALIKMKFGGEEQTIDALLRAIFLFVFGSGWVWEPRKFKILDMYYLAILPVFTCIVLLVG